MSTTTRIEQLQGEIPWEGRSFAERQLTHTVNRFFYRACGGRERPAFYDVDRLRPDLRALDRNFPVIREELEGILPLHHKLPSYQDLDEAQQEISSEGAGDWKVFVLYAMGRKPERNRALCPKTCALLDQVPDLFQAMFSILDPGKSIPPHRTGWMGYLRYHLPILVPKNNPPSIRVKDQWHTWQEGQGVMLDDSWEHEVRNESDGPRVVLIADILRPMPTYAHLVNKVLSRGAGYVYADKLLRKLEPFDYA